ncbi:hypothetical protein ABIE13_000292 [Ottowia thiooxydans]|uniref:Uncharacterized protein n=1 Tax=Ottowia thiooxydans TaxID=219182 RepID=A0ABV2Q2E2_9BURK
MVLVKREVAFELTKTVRAEPVEASSNALTSTRFKTNFSPSPYKA